MTLRVEAAERRFGAVRAVDEVSFHVESGEVVGLVGPNGSGKSTLLNLINGLLPMSAGTVTFQGKNIGDQPPHVGALLGIRRSFQLLRLMHGISVRENVMAGLYARAVDARFSSLWWPNARRGGLSASEQRQVTNHILARLGLEEAASVPADALPFGTQRLVELARAVVIEPKLLLLDEPAAGLDEQEMTLLGRLIADESNRGCTVILVDHHLDFLLGVCPRVLVMDHGRLIFDGDSERAVDDPAVREAYIGA